MMIMKKFKIKRSSFLKGEGNSLLRSNLKGKVLELLSMLMMIHFLMIRI